MRDGVVRDVDNDEIIEYDIIGIVVLRWGVFEVLIIVVVF